MRRFCVLARFRAAMMLTAAWSIPEAVVTILTFGQVMPSGSFRWFNRWAMRDDNYPGERE